MYKQAILDTKSAVVQEPYNIANPTPTGMSIQGGLENLKQSTSNSERVRDYRDYIKVYEELRNKYIAYRQTWVFRWSLAPMVPGLLD